MRNTGNDFRDLAVIVITLIVAVAVVGLIVTTFAGGGGADERITLEGDGSEQLIDVDDEAHDVVLKDSTGYGVAFDPLSGSVSAPAEIATDDGVTITSYAALDEEAATWRDYHLLSTQDGEIAIQLIDEEWVACADIDDESACASYPADDPYALTMVGATYDDVSGEISLAVDGDRVATEALEEDGDEIQPTDTWFGTVDEVRTLDRSVNDNELEKIADDPFAPQLSGEVSRLMFDEGEGDTTYVLFEDETVDLDEGADWTDGIEGSEISPDEFDVDEESGTISLFDDTRVASLPVVYASWGGGPITQIAGDVPGTIGAAFALGAVAAIVLVAAVILRTIRTPARLR